MPTSRPSKPVSESNAAASATATAHFPHLAQTARLGRWGWPIVCLGQFALLAALFMRGGKHPSPPEIAPVHEEHEVHAAPASHEASLPLPATHDTLDLRSGDDQFTLGRYDKALAIYRQTEVDASQSTPDNVRYRTALCLEALGQHERALAGYRELSQGGGGPAVVLAAQLGQARMLASLNHLGEANRLLSSVALRSGHPSLRDQPKQEFLAEARYRLALSLAGQLRPPRPPDPFFPAVLSAPATGWSIDRVLGWADGAGVATNGKGSHSEGVKVQKGPGEGELSVSATVANADVAELIDRLARESGWHTVWSPQARSQLEGRSAHVDVEKTRVGDFLRTLTEPLETVARIHGDAIHIDVNREMKADELQAARARAVRGALQEAVQAHPAHPLTAAAWLELANLDAAEHKFAEAVDIYTRLLRDQMSSPVTAQAAYNLALLQRRLGKVPAARKALFRVIDQWPGHELVALAWLQIGILSLEDGDPARSIAELKRAFESAAGSPAQPTVAIALAAAQLLAGQPGVAVGTLRSFRPQLTLEPYEATATFVDRLARYRIDTQHRDTLRAAELLAAARAFPSDSFLGTSGSILLGQAFHALRLDGAMAEVYEKALPSARGPMAAEMSYSLADFWYSADPKKRGPAKKRLAAVAAGSDGLWAVRARLRLAEIALGEDKPKECVALASPLLDQPKTGESPAVYQVLGQAYEQLGDFHQAARCYAGQKPE